MNKILNFNQMNYSNDILDRFKNKIAIPDDFENICWQWLGRTHYKYGQFDLELNNIKTISAHRFIYELYFGTIPNELVVRHNCDNCSCVNPYHLILGTQQENINDMVARDRQAKGSRSGRATLDEATVIEILERIKTEEFSSISQIARFYEIKGETIGNILDGSYWTHITKDFDLKQLKSMLVFGKSQLTKDEVLEIDELLKHGESVKEICSEYQVSQKVIYDIKYRNTHKDILK